jgi:IS605 OrfB family transposase
MNDFRLLVNQCLRESIASGVTSRGKLSRFARDRALEARVTGAIGIAASEIALSLASGHRRRLRLGRGTRVPYVRSPFVRLPNACFHFDPETGKLRVSLRRGEWTSLRLGTSNYHRRVLSDPRHRLTQMHLGLHRAIAIYAKTPEPEYDPTSLVALDTNESSLDGVRVTPEGATFVRVLFPEIRRIQAIHIGRRQYLGRKKAHDRRVGRNLLGREGRRERHRIRSRLHEISRSLIDQLAADHAALVLEDLTGLPQVRRRGVPGRKGRGPLRSRSFRGRMSRWPQGELHRQLLYKAEDRGVPVLWMSPYRTSRTCPRCGELSEHRSRVGPRFVCRHCGWELDRQLNAGVNLGLAALRRTAGLGGLRLDPDALPEDVVSPLYPAAMSHGAREERTGRERRDPSAPPR